jgi:nitroreductase
MDVKNAIETRRAYRSLAPATITEEIITELSRAASLAPTCNNFQPARFVFVHDPEMIKKLHPALAHHNDWIKAASKIIAVFSKKDMDCFMTDGREYYLYDTGTQVAFLILRTTELGLVAHPVAGYDPKMVKEILGIPEEFTLITLVNVGKHSDAIGPLLTDKQAAIEKERPERLPFDQVFFRNKYQPPNPK